MASTIQIKRGTGSAVPTGLADGELAINLDKPFPKYLLPTSPILFYIL